MTRLLILGGGVAGLDIASNLKRTWAGRQFDIALVDREPVHVWKPWLHTIASGTIDTHVQQTSYVAQAARRGFRFHQGDVIGIDRRARQVTVGPLTLGGETILPQRRIAYDLLLLALGSCAHDFGTPGVTDHCFTIDSRREALAFNDRFGARLLRAALAGEQMTVGIVGAGATGVELAAELVQLATFARGLGIDEAPAALRIVLLHGEDRILPPFPPRISAATQARLEQLGIEIRTNALVTAVDAQGFVLDDGSRVEAELKVWAAGIRAPAALATIEDMERSANGQLIVGPDLLCPDDPSIIALGDCARVRDMSGDGMVPATAQAAFQQAAYIGRYLPAIAAGQPAPPFRYRDYGALVSLGSFDAFGTLGKAGFIRGWIARMGHAFLYHRHQARIHGLWRAMCLWLGDAIVRRFRPFVRLS